MLKKLNASSARKATLSHREFLGGTVAAAASLTIMRPSNVRGTERPIRA